ncbi:cytochrome P450 monooxygenase [Xylaria sp. FL1042]|nr:cytochrome P450 monooxygenase [Xylaria sp. FL1042]
MYMYILSSLAAFKVESSVMTLTDITQTCWVVFKDIGDRYKAASLALLMIMMSVIFQLILSRRRKPNAPIVGYRSLIEPGWLVGLRFIHGSKAIIRKGYNEFKDTMFLVRRNDADILIISNKYVDQLRNMPEERISPIEAHIKNLLGHVSTTDILLNTNLHTRMLQQKLTTSLSLIMPIMKNELDYALNVELPKNDDEWVLVSVYDILLRLIARVSARVFIGYPDCRNEEWLSTSIHYTENVFITVMTLRMLPRYWHYVIAPFLPSYWRLQYNLRSAKRIIGPLVEQRKRCAAQGEHPEGYEVKQDLLQWMIDGANESEGKPETMAHIQLVVTLASIHTTTMAATHALYDLCANPSYFDPLRKELVSALGETCGWQKTTLVKLRKMDSFLKESQRMSPPSQLAFNRVVRERLELSDGTVLPVGTHFAMASDAIMHDKTKLAGEGDPGEFDGFRYLKLREDPADLENIHRYQFASTDNNSLHFGHGRYACPGRFFASNEIKMILGSLLLDYEFKFPDGQGRPENMSADENIFPDPGKKVLLRRRTDAVS